jgi:hypothetical protein
MPSLATEIISVMQPSTEIQNDNRPSRGRRPALIGAMLAIAVAAISAWTGHSAHHARESKIMLLYVGADDCAPCRAWRNGERPAFLASPEFARVIYREIDAPHLESLMNDQNWPEDVRDYRSRIRQSDGVPLWLVISDHAVVEQQFGTAAWRERILPRIRAHLR